MKRRRASSLLVQTLLGRGFVLWLGTRIVLFLVSWGAFTPLAPAALTSIVIVLLVGALALADIHGQREATLLADLGVSEGLAVALYAAPSIVLEALALVAFR